MPASSPRQSRRIVVAYLKIEQPAQRNKGGTLMDQSVAQSSLTDRMIRAARLDVALYNEVEADTTATNQALMVVVLVAVASGIGLMLSSIIAGRPGVALGGLI